MKKENVEDLLKDARKNLAVLRKEIAEKRAFEQTLLKSIDALEAEIEAAKPKLSWIQEMRKLHTSSQQTLMASAVVSDREGAADKYYAARKAQLAEAAEESGASDDQV